MCSEISYYMLNSLIFYLKKREFEVCALVWLPDLSGPISYCLALINLNRTDTKNKTINWPNQYKCLKLHLNKFDWENPRLGVHKGTVHRQICEELILEIWLVSRWSCTLRIQHTLRFLFLQVNIDNIIKMQTSLIYTA